MGNFGITKNTKSKNAVSIEAPTLLESGKYSFPVAKGVSVESRVHLNKDGDESDVLDIKFMQANGKEYTHREFLPDDTRENYNKVVEGLQSRLKHIYEAFAVFPEKGIGTKAKDWKGFFDMYAEALSEVISANPVHLKLVYYKGRLGFPLSPNFIDKAVEGKQTALLAVNLKYDQVTQEATKAVANDVPGFDDSAFDEGAFEESFEG